MPYLIAGVLPQARATVPLDRCSAHAAGAAATLRSQVAGFGSGRARLHRKEARPDHGIADAGEESRPWPRARIV